MSQEEAIPTTTLSLDEINIADPDFWLRDDVDGALALLREQRPVSWHEHPAAGQGFWALTDSEDIAEANSDWTKFVSRHGVRIDHDPGTLHPGTGALVELDPPKHTANRARVNSVFTPKQVRRLEGYVREQAQRLVSQFSDGDEVDFIDQLASPLPIEIVCDLVGVEKGPDRRMLMEYANVARRDHELEYTDRPEAPAAAIRALRAYGLDLAAKKLLDPKDDLLSDLAQTKVDGEGISKEELGGYFGLLISAGSGTTRNALAYGMLAFSQFPEQRRLYLENQTALEMSMADEVVRWASPLRIQGRIVDHDIEFRGVHMKKGQKVGMCYVASNRDPKVFKNPFKFDITRDPNPHQSFGAGGPHFCLGRNLARREIYVFFQSLFERFPKAEVISKPVKERVIVGNGMRSMMVRLAS
ncbi:cytochrome P450 [Rhizobium leguminosarum]